MKATNGKSGSFMVGAEEGGGTSKFHFGRSAKDEKGYDKTVYDINPTKDELLMDIDFDELKKNRGIITELNLIETIDFDIFNLRSVSSGNELVIAINYLMELNDYYDKLNIDKYKF